jgi:hypothetical protein
VIDMNKKLTITLPLLALLFFGIVGQTLAQTRVPGVHQEDYFIYDITSHWSSSNASLTVPPYLLGINDTRWYNVTVSSVQGINVTARTAQHFANGTDDNRLITLDVDSGSIYFMVGFQGFFDANLVAGDLLRPSGNDTVTINQTISRDYASGKRETNVLTLSYPVTDYTNSSLGTATVTYYIDKATGVLVERKDYAEFPDQNGSEVWVLKDTNLWANTAAPIPWLIITVVVVVIVVAIVSLVFLRNRKGHRGKNRLR